MFTVLLATALATTKFAGGSPNEFAASLAGAAKQSVIVEQGEGQVIRPCEFDASDLTGLARSIRTQTQMAILPGSELILSDGLLARKLVANTSDDGVDLYLSLEEGSAQNQQLAFQPLGMTKAALPQGAVSGGKVTLNTDKTDGLDLASLSGQMSKPVNVHWLLKDAVVCTRINGLPEDDFLKWVAKSVGGRLVSTAKDYTLDIDPVEIRRRALNTINRQVSTGNSAEVTIEERKKSFRISCLNSLNPTQMKAALATDGGETKVVLNAQNPLARSAYTYVQDLARYEMQQQANNGGGGRRNRGGGNANANALRQMDNTRPAYLVVDSRFNAYIDVPVRGNRYVRF